jgi:competence protein ComEA
MLEWLERHQLLVLAAVIAVFGLGFGVRELTRHSPPRIEFQTGPALAPGTPIRIHVAGEVVRPGVYQLKAGDRVQDAVTAAGGPTDAADAEAINLARKLRDEEQVVLPSLFGASRAGILPAAGAQIDINTASAEALNTLPGIGDVYSRRIIDSRRVDGVYRSTRDLVDRKVLPKAAFEKIRDLIVALP